MGEIIIVNEKDEIIRYKERGALSLKDIYRVSALWIENSKGEILLARRSFHKKHHPGMWGPAVAGTLEKGETYKSNIIKEAKEELGIENISLKKWFKKFKRRDYNHFTQFFKAIINKPIKEFKIQKKEVAEIKWFSKKELINMTEKNNPFLLKSLKELILKEIKT